MRAFPVAANEVSRFIYRGTEDTETRLLFRPSILYRAESKVSHVRARPIAIVVMLFTFAWVALAFFAAADTGRMQSVERDASLLQRSEAAATIVVGDRVTKVRSIGMPVAFGAVGIVALALMALRRLDAASLVGMTVPRSRTTRASVQRGPPVS